MTGETCGWCEKDWPAEKCGDEDGYGPRPPCGPRPIMSKQFTDLVARLSAWREDDHADNITLSRNDICELIHGVKLMMAKPGITIERLISRQSCDECR